jgi:hypothetical protein
VALLTAALTLMLVAVLTLAFMATMRGERAQSSNVQVARGSLYAADAGVRASQQRLANFARAKLDSLAIVYAGSGSIIKTPGSFFPAGDLVLDATQPKFHTVTTIAWADSDLSDSAQVYNYRYTVTSTGQSGSFGARVLQSQGLLRVSASRGTFADFLVFTNQHQMADGSQVWFSSSSHFDGRVYTNTQFRFAYQPTFEDLISSVNQRAWYYNLGAPVEIDADNNGAIDVPNLYGGFQRNAPVINLPANSYMQQNAALGFNPHSSIPPSNFDINLALGLSGSNPPPNGIYLPNDGVQLTGGLYVQGNLGSCTMVADTLGRQIYTMTQGGQTRIITVDYALGTTTFSDGVASSTYLGVPRGSLYTNGSILGLGGPDRLNGVLQPALADQTQLLVTARDDITLTNDLIYAHYDTGESVLGLYSDNGNVRVGTSCPNDVHLDAFVLAAGDYGEFTVDNFNAGSPRGTFYLRGGVVSQFYGAFYTFNGDGDLKTGYARDFRYDRRGIVPPYYPTTPLLIPNVPAARTIAWKEQ